MIYGYILWGRDNGGNMLKNITLDKCAKFSNVYDINLIDQSFKLPIKKYDLSVTYDGYKIASHKFRQFCEKENYQNVEFISLPGSPNFYWFKIHNVVELDDKIRRVKFLNYNEECKGFEEIIGAVPAYLKKRGKVSDGFFRSDIFFGSYSSKSPLYIIGEETMDKIKSENFSGIHFEKIQDKYEHINN